MKKKLLAAMIALFMLLPAAFALAQDSTGEEPLFFGPFSAENLNGGGTVTEAVFADASITLVNLWTTTCGYCIAELPDLATLSDLTGAKVQVIGVLLDGAGADGKRIESSITAMEMLISNAGVKYAVLLPDEFLMALGRVIQGVPTTFVVDERGEIRSLEVGARSADDWLKVAQAAADEAYEGSVSLTE